MGSSSDLGVLLAIWPIVGIAVLVAAWRKHAIGTGLVLAYVMNLMLFHWAAPLLYLDPSYWYFDPAVVVDGVRQSTFGVLAFTFAAVVLAPALVPVFRPVAARDPTPPRRLDARAGRTYLKYGLVCFFVLLPVAGTVSTLGSLIGVGWNLVIVGLAVVCHRAWTAGDRKSFLGWILVAVSLPAATMVSRGFLSYGTAATIATVAFITSFYRPRWHLAIALILGGYLAASGYVTYMRDRVQLRTATLNTSSTSNGFSDRLAVVAGMVTNFEWFDPRNPLHVERVDSRLNQSALIGSAVQNLDVGGVDFAYGTTVVDSFVALIPRLVWPDKPLVAGSGDLVSKFTNQEIADGTSVGVGHVMEFYVNFGAIGVVLGMLVLGTAMGILDRLAGERLRLGDHRGFTTMLLPGLAMLQVGGSMIELTTSVGASLVVAYLVNKRVPDRSPPSPSAAPAAAGHTGVPTPNGVVRLTRPRGSTAR